MPQVKSVPDCLLKFVIFKSFSQLPGLFVGCQFYFQGHFTHSNPIKEELIELVKLGGGTFLHREPKPGHLDNSTLTVPFYAPTEGPMSKVCIFAIYENGSYVNEIRTHRMVTLPASWIMASASALKLLEAPTIYRKGQTVSF